MRHADAYHRLNQELGLEDYEAFLEDKVAKERLDNLMQIRINHEGKPSIEDICRTLAVFGGFTENVNLFCQFAILKSFNSNGRNLMPNIANIIDWSQQDEKTHALAALHLFNIIKEENPQIWTDEFKMTIYNAAYNTFNIEKHLLEQIFAKGNLINLDKETLINFMKNRINNSLIIIGLKPTYSIDEELLEKMKWFENEYNVLQHSDFFHIKPTEYTKGLATYNSDTVSLDADQLNKLLNN
jgi:ribonucleoside-diphosphate reductase beta chain